jgi:glutamate decarboxylase
MLQRNISTLIQSPRDFKLPRVKSINTSGHKFGLIYAGLGWIVWRDEKFLPRDLIFEIDYLGASQETFTLSFSRPGAQVIAQYFNLVRLGFNGYQRIMEQCLWNARILSRNLESTGFYTCVSNIHRYACQQYLPELPETRGPFDEAPPKPSQQETSADFYAGLPVVAFGFSAHFIRSYPVVQLSEISRFLRAQGYLVPCKS